MKIILLLPVIAYLALVWFNMNLLQSTEVINVFNYMEISVPALLYSSIFLVIYVIFVFIVFDLRWIYLHRKIEKLEHEVFALKSRLYDEREDVLKDFISEYKIKLENFTKEQRELFEKFKTENEMDLLKQKWETDRILEKLNLLDKWIFDKIKETFKNKN